MTGYDLTLDEYQRTAAATDVEGDSDDPVVPLLGLAGEVGSLIAEFKNADRMVSRTRDSRKSLSPS